MLSTDDERAAAIARARLRGAVRASGASRRRRHAAPAGDAARVDVAAGSRAPSTPDWVMILLPTRRCVSRFMFKRRSISPSPPAPTPWSASTSCRRTSTPMRVVSIDDGGWARLFVNGEPVKRRPGRRQDMPQAWSSTARFICFEPRCSSIPWSRACEATESPPTRCRRRMD